VATEMFKPREAIEDFLEDCNVNMYKIYDDLSVDILDEEVNFSRKGLEVIPFKINLSLIRVLYLSNNPLKSTKDLPRFIKVFYISETKVKFF
jgi:hypothetical protein